MKSTYYKLPLDFRHFFENGGKFEKCSEIESIDQHIELLLTTCPGEHRFNPDYGCRIWEMDFGNVVSAEVWEAEFKQCIFESISRYERRINRLNLKISLRDVVKEDRTNRSVSVRKRADIQVSARLLSTDEPVRFRYTLYLGPLSNE